jgi:nucleoside phosphorylase
LLRLLIYALQVNNLIAIFSAFSNEISGFLKNARNASAAGLVESRLYRYKLNKIECLVFITGPGRRHAEAAAKEALGRFPISVALSAGCSGGLDPGTLIGDIVICSGLLYQSTEDLKSPEARSDAGLIKIARSITGIGKSRRILERNSITTCRIVAAAVAKNGLGRASGAGVVDMESYWIALAARERSIPFISIRSVSDTVEHDLSLAEKVFRNGKLAPGKLARELLRRPGNLPVLASYYRNFTAAEKSLSSFLIKFLNLFG